MEITVYDAVTGAVAYTCHVEDDADPKLMQGEAWRKGGVDGATHWINPETTKPNLRRAMPAKTAAGRLTGIPDGAEVIDAEGAFEVTGGVVAFEPDMGLEQTITVELRHPRFLPATVAVPISGDAPAVSEQALRRAVRQDVAALRRAEYDRRGLTLDALTIAQIEGDEAEIERIRAARAEVKAALPKVGRKRTS